MKTVSITAMLVILLLHTLQAQVPRTISLQGVLTDASGNLIPDGNHTLTLKLYDNAASPTAIFTEAQTVPVVNGVFNVIIGSVTALPTSLLFDRAYFLGVAVDGGLELAPRTALTAVPYALRADRANIADALSPSATGAVTSINNQSGALTMQGGGGTTVTNAGNAFTISSVGGGGTGIQGVQSTDGSLAIQNPNGPVANLSVASNAITKDRIATGQVVKSINNLTDDITLSAGSNVTITPAGNTITIASSGGSGGTGIQSLQTTNGTLDIQNPNGPVTTVNVGTNAINTAHIADGAVTVQKLAMGVIPASLPPTGAAGGDLSGTYPNPVIASNAVTSAKIADGTISTDDLADNSVTSGKIVDATIANGDLADNSVTSGKIVDATIATSDLADASVTAGKINSTGATSGQVLAYNGSNVAWTSLPVGGGTLDQAYDFGGAGNGRTITADAGALHVSGIDGFLSSGTVGSGTIPATGAGARMMWYPKKAAFRAGGATGSNWDDANIGNYSTAMGIGTKASGLYSISLGDGTTASGQNSTAMGHSTSATSLYATAMGSGSNANGDQSTAMGFGTNATASSSTAMGHQTTASGNISTAMGYQTTASGNTSTAMGSGTTASGNYSTTMGSGTTASGTVSTAMGYFSIASGSKSIAIGTSVTASGSNSTAMGNYTNTNSHDGAFVIGDNSTTTILNATTPQQFRTRFAGGYQLWSNSAMSIGARLDANATSWATLSDSTKKCAFRHAEGEHILSRFAMLRLGSWNYFVDQNDNNRHYGPMAQEWFAAFGHDGVGTIGNDTTLATADVDGVLCIAIKALEKRTSEQSQIISEQEKEITELRRRLSAIEEKLINNHTETSPFTELGAIQR